MHTGACWDKPRARQMLPKGQKGADVQMNIQASVISSACLKHWQKCTWQQPLQLWGEKCNSWIDYSIFSLPSWILLVWVFPWWHWGLCDLYCPPASATNAGCVLERLFLGFAKCNLEKNCLPLQEGVVRLDGLIFAAFCTCQELLIGTPGNVQGTSTAKRMSCHSLNKRSSLGFVSNCVMFTATTTGLTGGALDIPALVGHIIEVFRDWVKMALNDYYSNSCPLNNFHLETWLRKSFLFWFCSLALKNLRAHWPFSKSVL